jgi:hypothetical protein
VSTMLRGGSCQLGGLRMDAFSSSLPSPSSSSSRPNRNKNSSSTHEGERASGGQGECEEECERCRLASAEEASARALAAGQRRHVWYLHPGFAFFDMLLLPQPHRLCFTGLNLTLDTGKTHFTTRNQTLNCVAAVLHRPHSLSRLRRAQKAKICPVLVQVIMCLQTPAGVLTSIFRASRCQKQHVDPLV